MLLCGGDEHILADDGIKLGAVLVLDAVGERAEAFFGFGHLRVFLFAVLVVKVLITYFQNLQPL